MYFGMFELGAISAALALRLSTAVNKDPESGCARWQGMGADAMVLCWLLVAVLLSLHSILFAEPDHVTEGIVDSFLKTYAVFPVIAAVFMFCATANTGYAVAMLKHPVISRLGDYSFAVYLWQAALELGLLWPCQALAILRNCTLTRSALLFWQEFIFILLATSFGCDDLRSIPGALMFIIILYIFCALWSDIVEIPGTEWLRAKVWGSA